MKPILWAIAMAMCYAVSNVIIGRKLGSASPLPLMVFNYLTLLSYCFLLVSVQSAATKTVVAWPSSELLPWILGWAVIALLADYCFFNAYHSGGTVVNVTLFIALIPVFGVAIDGFTGGKWPTTSQLASIPIAAVAIYLALPKS